MDNFELAVFSSLHMAACKEFTIFVTSTWIALSVPSILLRHFGRVSTPLLTLSIRNATKNRVVPGKI
jgi:hypothetical protein